MRRTLELLAATSKTQLEIYKHTDIAPNWVYMFVNGQIPDPSVNRIEVLYNYLSETPLEVR